jgi:23S rRNA (cytosine1962-C5)-methyltransferase
VESYKVIKSEKKDNTPIKILNLFGYTGGATLAALHAGAEVTHVDGSKSAITWARQNAEASGLADKKVRWIEDDARKFVLREIKRGNKYDAIIMDPPAFGHGANKEVWKIEEDFIKLLDSCLEILSDQPLFVLVNGYSAGYSAIAYENSLSPLLKKMGGQIESGELTIEESKSGRLLPAGIFARWSR